MNKRPSIKDIAASLNVSVTTVSFVLNGKAKQMRISEQVTKKILDFAAEINYTPNQLAQSLRTGKTNLIVFMVEDISNHFFAKLARIIEVIAYKKGYKVIFCSNENDDKKTIELINIFKDRKVDGYIIIPSAGVKEEIRSLREEKIPVVLFDRYFPDLDTNYVIIDNENAAYKATRHLIDNGFKNPGFITIDVQQTQMQDRLNGYLKAIKEDGLEPNLLQLRYQSYKSQEGKKSIEDFFLNHEHLDAVFFATNYLTQTGLSVVKENHPHKLQDLGIITFDDNEYFSIHTPSISAVAQPLERIGSKLMEIMLELLKENGDIMEPKQAILKSSLKIRESSEAKNLG